MFKIDLAIKFGSNEISIYQKNFGIVSKQPAYLAVDETGRTIKVKAIGKEAEKLFMSKASNITVYQPMQNGEIENEKMLTILLSEMIKQVLPKTWFFRYVTALVAVPCATNVNQLKTIKKILNLAGVGKVTFVQNGVCVRANLDLDLQEHVMVVDIGKNTTDISVLNSFSFDFGRTYYIGGEDMDKCLTSFIHDNHNLTVSDLSSESIKREIASLYDRDTYKTEYIGIDDQNKLRRRDISASEVKVAIVNVYDKIFNLIQEVLKELPNEIIADIYKNGVVFVGGSSKIAGLYEYAKKKLDIPITVSEEAVDNVIIGAGKLLNEGKDFIKIKF